MKAGEDEGVDKILVTNKLEFMMKTVIWLTLYCSLNVVVSHT